MIRLPLDNAVVEAFSLSFTDHPVVVLGADKNDRARSRFDGAHELTHLVLHGEQICGVKEVETQAHQFAAAFLMPADDIYDQLPNTVVGRPCFSSNGARRCPSPPFSCVPGPWVASATARIWRLSRRRPPEGGAASNRSPRIFS
ncbi:ImmA/IrrE family metallo-endopeptidase [Streptomyces mirabilis]|uniref:ImmA/IrrE family metallo-endopeptidase n=1 Tax=Streptomyces mirabilis TaxID=68239 RepID=UPI0033B6B2CD